MRSISYGVAVGYAVGVDQKRFNGFCARQNKTTRCAFNLPPWEKQKSLHLRQNLFAKQIRFTYTKQKALHTCRTAYIKGILKYPLKTELVVKRKAQVIASLNKKQFKPSVN